MKVVETTHNHPKSLYCHRCNEAMREATKMDYDFSEVKELKIKDIKPIPYKIYLVCDNCYLGHWYDSRDLQ